jgi:aldoxime dehydratase
MVNSLSQSLAQVYLGNHPTGRLRVKAPKNFTVIRSGQDWSDCEGVELAQYSDSVRPAPVEGMTFLPNHPDETGCCDLRFAAETNRDGSPLKKTFGLGYFLTLGHLEKWAATHPTHLAIFSKFLTRYVSSVPTSN